ncbi:MAG: DUF928 domain-containing protein [Cyanobacteriota bacterium]|nr:DUF928 domain-containing protein [Cyanobacteriota bacterium]
MAFKFLRAVKILPIFLAFELLFSLNALQPVQAQPLSETEETVEEIIRTRVNFQPSSDGVPDGSASGGSRGNLGLLLPVNPKSPEGKIQYMLGLTTQANPTFFIYVGKRDTDKVNFTIIDQETQTTIYETEIDMSGDSGIISINLPANVASLEIGKTYNWVVGAIEENALETANGSIKRVELNPTVSSQLENADPLDQAVLYAENGIWFDTLEILAEQKQSQPDNEIFAAEWSELLKSVGLEDMATKPLVE